MRVSIINRQSALAIPTRLIKRLVKAVIEFEGQRCDEVSIYFVSTDEISQLHGQFFGDFSSTDCISFPIDADGNSFEYRVLGDVFVCPQVAINYSEQHEGNAKYELILYIVHGLLHLMGYDDIEGKDRLAMRKAEKRHMQNLENLFKAPWS